MYKKNLYLHDLYTDMKYIVIFTVEAVHIANQLCQYGYFFPVNDSKTLTVKDDSSLYRFQVLFYIRKRTIILWQDVVYVLLH